MNIIGVRKLIKQWGIRITSQRLLPALDTLTKTSLCKPEMKIKRSRKSKCLALHIALHYAMTSHVPASCSVYQVVLAQTKHANI